MKRGEVLATLDCRNASTATRRSRTKLGLSKQRQKAAAREAARLGELLDGGYAAPNEVEQKQAQSAANEAQIAGAARAGKREGARGKTIASFAHHSTARSRFASPIPERSFDPEQAIVEVVDRSVVRLAASVPEIDFDGRRRRRRQCGFGSSPRARRSPVKSHAERPVPNRARARSMFEVDLPNADTRDSRRHDRRDPRRRRRAGACREGSRFLRRRSAASSATDLHRRGRR